MPVCVADSIVRVFAVLLVASLLVACSPANDNANDKTPQTTDSQLAWSNSSTSGVYLVTIKPREARIPIGDYHQWIIMITGSDKHPVNAAQIFMTGGMPSHGHGLPTQPQVTEQLGDGQYLIEGVRFNMAGPWVLEFRINSALGADQATFNIELQF